MFAQTIFFLSQGDCVALDPVLDEQHQRNNQVDILGSGLEDQEDEGMNDGIATPPVYLSPSKSLSILRVDIHRVIDLCLIF